MRPSTSNTVTTTAQSQEPALLLRIGAVIHATGLARSTIYRLVSTGGFPAPVRLSARAVAWRRADVETWSSTRPLSTH